MQKNSELQQLFNNYSNLSEEQLNRLISLVAKQEKERLGLSLPVELKIDYDDLSKNLAGGDSTLDYDEKTQQYKYTIRLNGNEWYKQYLLNRNQTHQNGNMTFESSLDSLYNLIARVCHEMRHAYQNEQTHVRSDLSNPEALVWLKQELVIPDEEFYRESHNYSNMPREVDAFNYQYQQALDYIRSYTNIEKDNPEFFATLQQTLNRNQRENVKPLEELTFIVNGEEIKATTFFNQNMVEAMKSQGITPEIIENSILRYEYNSDYSKKTLEQLMADKQKMIEELDDTLPNYEDLVQKIDGIYNAIISSDVDLQKQNQKSNKTEQPSRRYVVQDDPEIKVPSNHINYTEFQRQDDGKAQTEKRKSPLMNESKEIIGESEEVEVYDYSTGTSTRNRYETIEGEKGVYAVDTEVVTRGESYSVHSTTTVNNELSGSKEKSVYTRDENGNENYTYMENGQIGQKITKTDRGTTIDIYKNGQPYATYEYDENGKAIIPMGEMEQLPEDYVEFSYKISLPEYMEISHREPEEQKREQPEEVSTQKLGRETLDMQQDTKKIDDVEQQMSEQMKENEHQVENEAIINEFGEIIRPAQTQSSFRESMKFDVSSNEYAQETLRKFRENLENGTLDQDEQKKKDSHKVEKGDDDYVM